MQCEWRVSECQSVMASAITLVSHCFCWIFFHNINNICSASILSWNWLISLERFWCKSCKCSASEECQNVRVSWRRQLLCFLIVFVEFSFIISIIYAVLVYWVEIDWSLQSGFDANHVNAVWLKSVRMSECHGVGNYSGFSLFLLNFLS